MSGKAIHPNTNAARLNQAGKEKQTGNAYATIISCSDSRVPVELIFDAGIMDLFIIRVAGNVVDTYEAGSIEYGLAHVETPLFVVLGHTQCGAVTTGTEAVQGHGHTLEINIQPLVDKIKPAVKRAMAACPLVLGEDIVPFAIEENVWESIRDLFMKSATVRDLVKAGKVKVVGALYDVGKGTVTWLPEKKVASILAEVENTPLPQPASPQGGRTIGQYIDHGNGTITDTKTSLMWKRCSEGRSGVNCEEGKTEEYKYDEAVQRFQNVAYACSSDWRLPTVDELKTLVYCSKGVKDKDSVWCNDGSEQPMINQQAFPNTNRYYWSGSPYAGNSDLAWFVGFDVRGGVSYFNNRSGNYAVRLVRNKPNAEPPPQKIGQYIDHGNGTITDTASKLMWKRCAEGLSGVNCAEGEPKKYTWNDAVQRFKNDAGSSDWRLPTVEELKTLVDGSKQPTINQQAFPNTTTMGYWSGSPLAGNSGYAWFVSFYDGNSGIYSRDGIVAVRLVRGGQ